jgi:hypothetical protein
MFGLGPLEILGIVALVLFISRRLSDSRSDKSAELHDLAALRDEVAALHDRFDNLDRAVANLDDRLSALNGFPPSPSEAVRAKTN